MLILPWRTDAPIYHFPYVTLGLIAINSVIYLITRSYAAESEWIEAVGPWTLQFGVGLKPLQWVTWNFLHMDMLHVGFNMFFLWGFGIIVEGKVGPLVYGGIYLLIGTIEGLIVQALMLGTPLVDDPFLGISYPKCALGASGAIFGILLIAMVWAPKNDFSCILIWFTRILFFDMSTLSFTLLFMAFEAWDLFVSVSLFESLMSSAFLHIVGGGVGFAIGAVMVKAKWVDCEKWDLFAVMTGKYGRWADEATTDSGAPRLKQMSARERKKLETKRAALAERPPEEVAAKASGKLQAKLDAQDALGALETYEQLKRRLPDWEPTEVELVRLIKGLHEQSEQAKSIPAMAEFIRRFPAKADPARVKLAQILIKEQRPSPAEKLLQQVDIDRIPEAQRPAVAQLRARAAKMIEEGVLELEDERI